MAGSERTFVIIKPDAVQRGLIGPILTRYEQKGLKIVAMRLETINEERAKRHYGEHEGKPFFNGLIEFITSGPSVTMVLEGPNAIGIVREMNGKTKPVEAAPGTIRADFGLETGRNLVHASDGPESALKEITNFFGDEVGVSWSRDLDRWILE